MIRRPPRSTLFPTRRSSDLSVARDHVADEASSLIRSCAGQPAQRIADEDASAVRINGLREVAPALDRKSTRLNSSHANISYAVFCLKKNTDQKSRAHSLLNT